MLWNIRFRRIEQKMFVTDRGERSESYQTSSSTDQLPLPSKRDATIQFEEQVHNRYSSSFPFKRIFSNKISNEKNFVEIESNREPQKSDESSNRKVERTPVFHLPVFRLDLRITASRSSATLDSQSSLYTGWASHKASQLGQYSFHSAKTATHCPALVVKEIAVCCFSAAA